MSNDAIWVKRLTSSCMTVSLLSHCTTTELRAQRLDTCSSVHVSSWISARLEKLKTTNRLFHVSVSPEIESEVSRKASQRAQNTEPRRRWVTTTEDHIRFFSWQERTWGAWGDPGHKLGKKTNVCIRILLSPDRRGMWCSLLMLKPSDYTWEHSEVYSTSWFHGTISQTRDKTLLNNPTHKTQAGMCDQGIKEILSFSE